MEYFLQPLVCDMFWEAQKFLWNNYYRNTFVSKSDKTKQKNRRGREPGRGLPRWNKHARALGYRHTEWPQETLYGGFPQWCSLSVARTWLTPPSLLPQETWRAPSCQSKDKLCFHSSQRWQVKYSLPLKGNGCFCSFFKSYALKQEELHGVLVCPSWFKFLLKHPLQPFSESCGWGTRQGGFLSPF